MPIDRNSNNNKSFGFYLFCLLVFLILLGAAILLLPVWKEFKNQENELAKLREEITSLKNERNEMLKKIADLEKSPDAVEKVAREKFHFCKDGEIIMYYRKPTK